MNLSKKVIFFGAFVHLICAYFSQGHLHPDEHFQILEYFDYLRGYTSASNLPWEFHVKMRPWTLPYTLFLLEKFLSLFSAFSPFTLAVFFRLLFSMLGFYSSLCFVNHFIDNFDKEIHKKIFLYSSLFLWFIPFIHARISAEAIAGSLFAIGMVKLLESNKKKSGLYTSAVFLSISSLLRYHLAFLIIPIWILALKDDSNKTQRFIKHLLMFTSIIILGSLLDTFIYKETTFAPWNYFYQNIILKKSSNYGTSPFWYYLKEIFNKGVFPIGPLILFSFFYPFFLKRFKGNRTFRLALIPFLLIHTFVAHKELRFLFPLITFVPLFLTELIRDFNLKKLKPLYILATIVNIAVLIKVSFTSVHPSFSFFKFLAKNKQIDRLFIYGDTDPFFLAQLPTRFYHKPLPIIKVQDKIDPQSILKNETGPMYFFSNRGKFYNQIIKNKACSSLYQNIPKFILKFNFFNWQKRSKMWSLIKCPGTKNEKSFSK